MYYQEKRTIVSSVSSALILGFYSLYVYQRYVIGNPDIINDFKFWGTAILILIPVTILAQIIIHIVFVIINKIATDEDVPAFNDERDKLIELKGTRISHWIFILGFFLAMGTQVMEMPPYVMFLTLIVSGFLAAVISDITKFILYRRGF